MEKASWVLAKSPAKALAMVLANDLATVIAKVIAKVFAGELGNAPADQTKAIATITLYLAAFYPRHLVARTR